jgi:hypothetical protein
MCISWLPNTLLRGEMNLEPLCDDQFNPTDEQRRFPGPTP